jgi:peptide/nickel transport system ATP-binding protein
MSVSDAVKLRAEGLQCYFGTTPGLIGRLTGSKAKTVRAVEDVSFDVRQGETFSLVGESGCGKSTVARLLVGLYSLSKGKLTVEGAQGRHARKMPPNRRSCR